MFVHIPNLGVIWFYSWVLINLLIRITSLIWNIQISKPTADKEERPFEGVKKSQCALVLTHDHKVKK